jgi:hypothetical protein
VSGLPPHAVTSNDEIVAIVSNRVLRGHGVAGHWYLESWNGTRRCLSPTLQVTETNRYVGGPFAGPRNSTAVLNVEFDSPGDGEITVGPSRNCFTVPLYDAAPTLIRDMIDALFVWRDVADLLYDRIYPPRGEGGGTIFDRFDLVAITSRFLGGRAVVTRGQLAYFC